MSTLQTKKVYTGKILSVRVDDVLLSDRNIHPREVVEVPDTVGIVAITIDKKIVMVRQYRRAVGQDLIEIPAGKIDPGEDPETAARRELTEETGCIAGKMRPLLEYHPAPGYSTEKMHLFLADVIAEGNTSPDDDEFVTTQRIPLDMISRIISNGWIKDGKSIIGIRFAIQKV